MVKPDEDGWYRLLEIPRPSTFILTAVGNYYGFSPSGAALYVCNVYDYDEIGFINQNHRGLQNFRIVQVSEDNDKCYLEAELLRGNPYDFTVSGSTDNIKQFRILCIPSPNDGRIKATTVIG